MSGAWLVVTAAEKVAETREVEMAEGVLKDVWLCEWSPEHGRPLRGGDALVHQAGACFVVYLEDGSSLRLCEDCTKLDRFKSAKKERLPWSVGRRVGAVS